MPPGESDVTIACVQFEPRVGAKDATVARSLELIDDAVARGATIVVLPELANSGYVFATRAEAFAAAEPVPGGPTSAAWAEAAARHGIHIVAGICERDGEKLFNSAVLIGPQGHVGTFRKVHLWGSENLFFEPGDRGFPVFATPVGRIGMAICYDGWFPESFRLCALQGAELICVPTNWVPIPGQEAGRQAMAVTLHMAAAHSNSVFIACADRIGTERGQPFEGQSVIIAPTGWPLAGPASREAEEIVTATINLADARRARRWGEFNNPLRDRRTDLYAEMLGASTPRGWY